MSVRIALLRGVNVGGRNRLPMPALRESLAADGIAGALTYINSGNIVLDADGTDVAVAVRVHDVIERDFGLAIAVIVVGADELAEIVAANPYPHEPDHKRLHAIVMAAAPDAQALAALDARVAAAAAKGCTDTISVIGRTAYLHTPEGFGASELAKAVGTGARNPVAQGTARNWATITKLRDLASAARQDQAPTERQ